MKSILVVLMGLFSVSSAFSADDLQAWVGSYRANCEDFPGVTEVTYQNGVLSVGEYLVFSNINAGKQVEKLNTEIGYIRKVISTDFEDGMLTRLETWVNYRMWVIPSDQSRKDEILTADQNGNLQYTRIMNRADEESVTCQLVRL